MNKIVKQAFTLIELLVVIAIIGILSGLIVVGLSGMTQKANIAKSQIFANSLKNSLLLNLVSEWRFDENTGTTTADSWSGGNGGTLSGTTLPVWKNDDCVNGSCIQFDGSDDYVDAGSKLSLSMGLGDATVSLWVKFDNALASQNETLIDCATLDGPIRAGYWLYRAWNTNRLYGAFSDGTTTSLSAYLSPSASLVANTWYNVVVVFNRTSVAQAYINGVKQSQSLTISGQPGIIVNQGTYKIGGSNPTYYRLTGKMDEIRLYNAAMPISQIREQYYAGLNSLLAGGEISENEYQNRLIGIK